MVINDTYHRSDDQRRSFPTPSSARLPRYRNRPGSLPLGRRRFRLTPDGLNASTSFGCKRFVRWADIASLHFSRLFGFVLTLGDGRKLYLPGALHGLASFSEEAAARLTADRMTVRAKAKISAYRARLV